MTTTLTRTVHNHNYHMQAAVASRLKIHRGWTFTSKRLAVEKYWQHYRCIITMMMMIQANMISLSRPSISASTWFGSCSNTAAWLPLIYHPSESLHWNRRFVESQGRFLSGYVVIWPCWWEWYGVTWRLPVWPPPMSLPLRSAHTTGMRCARRLFHRVPSPCSLVCV